jgi:hypothetical protein
MLQAWTGVVHCQEVEQREIPTVQRMPAVPDPLEVRPWGDVARRYYDAVFDPSRTGEGFPAVQPGEAGQPFLMKSYLAGQYDTEAVTCLAGVAGAKLAGLDPGNLHGVDFLSKTDLWFDPGTGLFRHRAGQRGGEIHGDIYGYWPAIQGLILADLYPQNPRLQEHARAAFGAFSRIAHGLGAPLHPDFSGLGWNLETNAPAGRNEPMNRLGNAPAVAWSLMAGNAVTGDQEMATDARSIMQWYIDHPGRYEVTHLMGPLTVARLNATTGANLDIRIVLNAWFGDGPEDRCPWFVTSGQRIEGITCDGLDVAHAGKDFYAFSMGSLQGPAWLAPVVRYEPGYAKAIGKYLLHAANSCRLLEGFGLGAERQDHPAWKASWDKEDLFFYEGLRSWEPVPGLRRGPYATGDPVALGWTDRPKVMPENYRKEKDEWFGARPWNISLYMGNHVGFLGGIMQVTSEPGILAWDCVKTDWFHPAAFPTRLVYNPFPESRTFKLDLGSGNFDVFDIVSRRVMVRGATGLSSFTLAGETASVMVLVPSGSEEPRLEKGRLVSGSTVIEWQAGNWTLR